MSTDKEETAAPPKIMINVKLLTLRRCNYWQMSLHSSRSSVHS